MNLDALAERLYKELQRTHLSATELRAALAQAREDALEEAFEWFDNHAFTAYRNRDPGTDGLCDHVTLVNEDAKGTRRGIVAPTMLAALWEANMSMDAAVSGGGEPDLGRGNTTTHSNECPRHEQKPQPSALMDQFTLLHPITQERISKALAQVRDEALEDAAKCVEGEMLGNPFGDWGVGHDAGLKIVAAAIRAMKGKP